jgi:hypothetical protein
MPFGRIRDLQANAQVSPSGGTKMKKFLFIITAFIALSALLLSGCDGFRIVRGAGNIVDKQYELQGFSAVEASSGFSVDVGRSDSFSLVISTHENIVDYLNVEVNGDILKLGLKPGSYTNSNLKAVVTMPRLKSLKLSGASSGSASGFSDSDDFKLDLSGASHLYLDSMETGKTDITISGVSAVSGQLRAGDSRLVISGASHSELSGSGGELALEVSGASHATLTDFPVTGATLDISGASGAAIRTDGALNVNVSGASSVDYYGTPSLNNVNVTGASRLNKKS